MASNANKWLLGCGIGCGGAILLFLILIGVAYLAVKDTVKDFKTTIETFDRLEEEYGRVRDFVPDPAGDLPSARIEAFLAVRESIDTLRQEMESAIQTLENRISDLEEGEKPFWQVIGVVGKGMGALPQLAKYFNVRNRAMLDNGMGLGEYYYLYSVIYYSWLKKSPGDGPPFRIMGDEDSGYYRYDWEYEQEEKAEGDTTRGNPRYGEDYIRRRNVEVSRYINHVCFSMMRKQMAQVPENAAPSWRKRLAAELDAMEKDLQRIPWQDGLPSRYLKTLEPYRERFEAAYSFTLNPLELQPVSGSR